MGGFAQTTWESRLVSKPCGLEMNTQTGGKEVTSEQAPYTLLT